jgi:hypothetical protein
MGIFVIVSIGGIGLPLQFKGIRSVILISVIRDPVPSGEYGKTFSHDMNGHSAISYL